MNNFKKLVRDLASKEKTYTCSEIEVRVYKGKEDIESCPSKHVAIYTRESNNKSYPLKEYEFVNRATNINDEKDVIDYKLISLPGGRVDFGGYLYPENLDKSQFDFYSFRDLWYKIFGEELSSNRVFTIEELIGILQIFKSRIDQTKYQGVYEVTYKDSFQGERKFRGSRYFGGVLKGEKMEYEQINGDDNIQLEENLSNHRKNDTVFQLINLCIGLQNSKVYDIPCFTKDALRKIIKLREKEKEIEK